MKDIKNFYKKRYRIIKAEQSQVFKLLFCLNRIQISFDGEVFFHKKGDGFKSSDLSKVELRVEKTEFIGKEGKIIKGFMLYIIDHFKKEIIPSKFIKFMCDIDSKNDGNFRMSKSLIGINEIDKLYQNPDQLSCFRCEFNNSPKRGKGNERNRKLLDLHFNLSVKNEKIDLIYFSFFYHRFNPKYSIREEKKKNYSRIIKEIKKEHLEFWGEKLNLINNPYFLV